LQELHADAFHGLTFGNYGILNMSPNQLQVLPPKVFDGLKLNQLSLQSNVLSRLHAETFHGLTFSWNGILDISRNKLQDLPPKVFNCTARLEILVLADNELSTLSDDVFYGLSDLRSLRLEGNRLRSLGDRPFYQLYHLEELHLAQNLLEDLDDHVFDSLSVSVCYSAGCVHHSLKRRLLELHLGGNRRTALHDGLFKGFRSLRTLQLQSNQLARLPKQLFQFPGKVYGVIEFPSM
jgi:Leucine-rich repeat (LRR) protein